LVKDIYRKNILTKRRGGVNNQALQGIDVVLISRFSEKQASPKFLYRGYTFISKNVPAIWCGGIGLAEAIRDLIPGRYPGS